MCVYCNATGPLSLNPIPRLHLGRVKRIWYLSPVRTAKVQASLRIRAVSPEPPLLAHTSSESRGTYEWLGMRSYKLSWRNTGRHKFAWHATFCHIFQTNIYKTEQNLEIGRQKFKRYKVCRGIANFSFLFILWIQNLCWRSKNMQWSGKQK